MPDTGFLFPAFIDRSTDIHNVLYYTKKPEELHDSFISNILGTSLPITAGEQKDVFQEIVAETLGDDCNYDMVRTIHDNLNEMIEQSGTAYSLKKHYKEPADRERSIRREDGRF